MECSICTNDFDSVHHRPVIGSCGHTVCHQCRSQLGQLNNYACPSCKKPMSFVVESTNYQFLELQAEMKSEKEDRERRHQKELEQCLKALKEKERMVAVAQREKQEMVSAEECHCRDCGTTVSHRVARICLDCSFRDAIAAGTDMDQLTKLIICPTCFLDGTHKGHNSKAFLYVKLTVRGIEDFDRPMLDAREKDAKMEEWCSGVAGMYRGCGELLRELRGFAVSQPSEKDYEELADLGKQLYREYDGTVEKFNEFAAFLIDKDKTIRKLVDVIEQRLSI